MISGYICKYIALNKLHFKNTITSQTKSAEDQDIRDKWNTVKEYVRNQFSSIVYKTWFKPMKFQHCADKVCYISVPCAKASALDYINDKFGSYFEDAFRELCGSHYAVQFIISEGK